MYYKEKLIPFPAVTKISFSKLIDYLTEQEKKAGGKEDKKLSLLLEDSKRHPALLEGINIDDFDKNLDIIQGLCSTLFPGALSQNEIKGVITPFNFSPFYVSERFKKILGQSNEAFQFDLNNFNEDQMYIYGCCSILSFYYSYPFALSLPIYTDLPQEAGVVSRKYRIMMNGDLLEIEPSATAIDITKEDYQELLSDFGNISLWKKKFPPNSWIMKGIGLITLFDVTQTNAISEISSKLLIKPLKNLNEILDELKVFLEIDDMSIGFLEHDKNAFVKDSNGLGNLTLTERKGLSYKESLCAGSFQRLIVQRQPIIITDVQAWNKTSACSIFSSTVEELDYGSYMLIPIIHNGVSLGYLELASRTSYALNGAMMVKINLLLPTLGMALSRNYNELQNRKEAVIQQKFTSIHPSVKWRFEEEAIKFIKQNDDSESEDYDLTDIVFPNVFALYGQMDIKSSTHRRNDTIKSDLLEQILMVEEILTQIWKKAETPIYEELLFRASQFKVELKEEGFSDFEQNINYFIHHHIHPLFDKFKLEKTEISKQIKAYESNLDPLHGAIYKRRKLYDKAVFKINKVLSGYIDKKQLQAQEMFPHYFERYKTDGVEYNMYIGDSISQEKNFSEIDHHNLQLWQLMTNCEMELIFKTITTDLDLEIASLILVYSTPLAVQFRIDEKRFDVAGAYNARYEIIKKRIDKAHIKGTKERITCPGKICIIYANPEDAKVYQRYISFLENKNYLIKNSTEMLEVEDLPGITGLKALRVGVNYEGGITT